MSDWRAQEERRQKEAQARAQEEAARKAAALQAIKEEREADPSQDNPEFKLQGERNHVRRRRLIFFLVLLSFFVIPPRPCASFG